MIYLLACTSTVLLSNQQEVQHNDQQSFEHQSSIAVFTPSPSSSFPKKGVVLERGFAQDFHCEQQFTSCIQRTDDLLYYPAYRVETLSISKELQRKMTGKTWRKGCPVGFKELSLLRFLHWNQQAGVQWGELIVAKEEAQNMASIFAEVYALYFPMTSVRLMHEFEGNDDLSMKANNTSAFNCRKIKRSKRYSEHSYGKAIDINPLWNPWVNGKYIDPPEGKRYIDRDLDLPGLITNDHRIIKIFSRHGWKWGGFWRKQKDYQHFSVSGR